MGDNEIRLLEYGCDWITATAPLDHENQSHMDAVFYAYATKAHDAGHTMKNVRRLGYTGQQIAGVFIGSSKQGSMMQASAQAAKDVLLALRTVCTCIHITRLDVQATIQLREVQDVALSVWEQTERAKAKVSAARRWNAAHIHTADAGCTANVGSRSSAVCIRVYDKTREMMPTPYPENAWRYEVELKQEVAQRVYDNWPKAEDDMQYSLSVIATALQQKGIDVPWNEQGLVVNLRTTRPVSDEERKLLWLRGYVKNTVQLLCFRGLREEVLDALGLVMV